MYSQDGYKLIRADELAGVLDALNDREISFRAFRAYFGCFELIAIREAAERSTVGKQRQRRFLRTELAEMIGAKEGTTLSKELSSLSGAGLLTFNQTTIDPRRSAPIRADLLAMLGSRGGKRLVPVPRQALKFLARCTRPALAKTVVAYLLRGLALERTGKIRSAGTVKISWICRLCRISERAARGARAELIRLGWITKDTGSFQRKLNRDGAYFVINPVWRRSGKSFAPLAPEKPTQSAPPIQKPETPNGSKNQKPGPGAGVCIANGGEVQRRPSLRDIKVSDLQRLSRLKVLYRDATAAKWLSESEANFRNFIAAAARATRVDGDSVRVFVGIVRKGLWHHLTASDEDRAVQVLNRERERRARTEVIGTPEEQIFQTERGEGTMRMVLHLAMSRSAHAGSETGLGRLLVIDISKGR